MTPQDFTHCLGQDTDWQIHTCSGQGEDIGYPAPSLELGADKGCSMSQVDVGLSLIFHTGLHGNLRLSHLSGTWFPPVKGKVLYGGLNGKNEFKTKGLIVWKTLELKSLV